MKFITVPINEEALNKLMYDKADSNELSELLLSQQEVNELFISGFFDRLNLILDINIDDFEDEEITDMRKLIIFKNFLQDHIKNDPQKIYQDLYRLVSIAIEKETGIFFFF